MESRGYQLYNDTERGAEKLSDFNIGYNENNR